MKLKNIIFISSSLFLFFCFASNSFAKQQTITLGQVNGDVQVISEGVTSSEPGSIGMRLYEGDTIKTGRNSSAEIFFKGIGMITLGAKAEFTIQKAEQDGEITNTENFLKSGQLKTRVRRIKQTGSQFVLKTPVAVVAVRGTTYILTVTLNGQSTVYVADGIVELKSILSGLGVTINPGEISTASPDGKVSKPSKDVDLKYIDLNLDSGVFEATPTEAEKPESRDVEADKIKTKKKYSYSSS